MVDRKNRKIQSDLERARNIVGRRFMAYQNGRIKLSKPWKFQLKRFKGARDRAVLVMFSSSFIFLLFFYTKMAVPRRFLA